MFGRMAPPLRKDTEETLVSSPTASTGKGARLKFRSSTKQTSQTILEEGQFISPGKTPTRIPEVGLTSNGDKVLMESPTCASNPSSHSNPVTPNSLGASLFSNPDSSSAEARESQKARISLEEPSKSKGDSYESAREVALTAARVTLAVFESLDVPYLKGAASFAILILDSVDGVAANKEECSRIVHKVSCLLCALERGTQASSGRIPEELEEQAIKLEAAFKDVSTAIKKLSKRCFLSKLLMKDRDMEKIKRCNAILQDALDLFSVESDVANRILLADIQDRVKRLERPMNGTPCRQCRPGALGVTRCLDEDAPRLRKDGILLQQECSEQFTSCRPVLPGPPDRFVGRDSELKQLVQTVCRDEPARIAILGSGGIGKSTLSIKLLLHEDVIKRYQGNRFFVSCDSASSVEGLVSAIASQMGLGEHHGQNKDQYPQRVVRILTFLKDMRGGTNPASSSIHPAFIVLDNFESVWEPDRKNVEEFLARLGSVKNLTIAVTLRGTERPRGLDWTLPVFPHLQTLDPEAGREMFLLVSGADYTPACDKEEPDELGELLRLCGYLPLAIRLMAELTAIEDGKVGEVLKRWRTTSDCISVPSNGEDRDHSLEVSIELSLTSPRMKQVPEAAILLSLLSVLPDGIQGDDLDKVVPSLRKREEGRLALIRTALANRDQGTGRLKVLAPIRAYVMNSEEYRPRPCLIKPLEDYLWGFIGKAKGVQRDAENVRRILAELGNIECLIDRAFRDDFDPTSAISAAVDLGQFFLQSSLGKPRLAQLQKALERAEQIKDEKMQADCIYTMALARHRFVKDSERCGDDFGKALALYKEAKDKVGEGNCLNQLAAVSYATRRFEEARGSAEEALRMHAEVGCLVGQATALLYLARILHAMNASNALCHCQRALELLRGKDIDLLLEAQCLQFLGYIQYTTLSNYTIARELLEDSFRIYKRLSLEESSNCMDTIVSLGVVALIRSSYEDAKNSLARAAENYRKHKRPDREADARVNLGVAHLGLGSPLEASKCINDGLVIWERFDHKWGMGTSYVALGDVSKYQRDFSQAETHYRKALGYFEGDSGHWKPFQAECLMKLGVLGIQTNQEIEARRYIQSALNLFEQTACRRYKANCLRYLAELDLKYSKGEAKRNVLARLESLEREYSDMGLEAERKECALLIMGAFRESPPGLPRLRIEI